MDGAAGASWGGMIDSLFPRKRESSVFNYLGSRFRRNDKADLLKEYSSACQTTQASSRYTTTFPSVTLSVMANTSTWYFASARLI